MSRTSVTGCTPASDQVVDRSLVEDESLRADEALDLETQRAHELDQAEADRPADQRADEPDDRALDDEDPAPVGGAESDRLEDRDVARLLEDHCRDDVDDPEAGDDQDRADGRVHDRVLDDEDPEHVGVRFLPRLGAIAEALLELDGERLRLLDIGEADADLVDHVGPVLHDLRLLKQRVGGAPGPSLARRRAANVASRAR
jgi:hypothetical protein